MIHQYSTFIDKTVEEKKSMFSFYSSDATPLEEFLNMYMGSNPEYHLLWTFFKKVLILSHGQASVERGFSLNKNSLRDNISEEDVISRRLVLDKIRTVGGVLNVNISKEMKMAVRGARTIWEEKMKDESRKKDSEENRKRKLDDERRAVMAKAMKLEKEKEALEEKLKAIGRDLSS